MAVTRSTAADRRTAPYAPIRERGARILELIGLFLCSVAVMAGLALVWKAKTAEFPQTGSLLNLNTLDRPEQLLPLLGWAPNARERQFLAKTIWDYAQDHRVPNVGALGRIPGRNGAGRLLTPPQIATIKAQVIV